MATAAKNLAFYAPMKSPDHPIPSGDRAMARAVIQALDSPECSVKLVSNLRLYDGAGDAAMQTALMSAALAEAKRIVTAGAIDAWVTYHNYYKAPDLIGPVVAAALNIPYILIEASRSAKRLTGAWASFAEAAEAACDAADVIFYLTERDAVALRASQPDKQQILPLAPFLARDALPSISATPVSNRIFAAGMMRAGDKLASFAEIATILPLLETPDWELHIAGDGAARPEVEALLASFEDRTQYLGALDEAGMTRAYENASVFLWPGVNEAFGMVYLEAQGYGVPVVAQAHVGPASVLPNNAVFAPDDLLAQAQAVDALLQDQAAHTAARDTARTFVQTRHLLPAARHALWAALSPLLKG